MARSISTYCDRHLCADAGRSASSASSCLSREDIRREDRDGDRCESAGEGTPLATRLDRLALSKFAGRAGRRGKDGSEFRSLADTDSTTPYGWLMARLLGGGRSLGRADQREGGKGRKPAKQQE
jgi:hypothetical protein